MKKFIGLFLIPFIPIALFAAGPTLQVFSAYVPDARRAIALPDGGTLIVGTQLGSAPYQVSLGTSTRRALALVKVSGSMFPDVLVSWRDFGQGNDIPSDAAVDRSGNIWVTGTTDSDDFPLVNAPVTQKAPYQPTGFVTKLDPTGKTILFSTFLGGHQLTRYGFSNASDIVLDAAGNAYILGNTTEPDFPQTTPVLGNGAPNSEPLFATQAVYTFVTKIAPDGKLLFSVLLGGIRNGCSGGSHCIGKGVSTVGTAISLEANGNITVGGLTGAIDFPTTANAFQPRCICGTDEGAAGFVSRISSTGKSLVWSTYLGATQRTPLIGPSTFVTAMALDAAGNVYAAGYTYANFPVTPGAVQPTLPTRNIRNTFAAKLSNDGASLLYGTYLGGAKGASVSGLALDSGGNVWIAGSTNSPEFPSLANTAPLGDDFVLQLNSGGTAVTKLYRLHSGSVTQKPVLDTNGNLLLLASQGTLITINTVDGLSRPGLLGFGNSASLQLDAGFGSGELVSLYGVGLGPAQGIAGAPDSRGFYPTVLGGVQVLVDAKPMPLLYVGANQINFQAPFPFSSQTALQVVTPTGALPAVQPSNTTALGLFHSDTGAAVALNQDGSVNSATNPAVPGSVVSLFATGLVPFPTPPPLLEGSLWRNPGQFFLSVDVPGSQVLYAGAAPGLINGIQQINVQLAPTLNDPRLRLTWGTAVSNSVFVYAH